MAQKLDNNRAIEAVATLLVSEDWYEKERLENEKGNYQRAAEYLLKATEVDDEKKRDK